MALLEFFRPKKATTASVAKERLQIIVAERRSAGQGAPSYLPQLKLDLLEVIRKYVHINPDQVSVNLDQKDEDLSVLELNVTLPEDK
ncbi:cell division topological specificity factor MinE [Photobacterium profundum]|jgi:cell division topological specificity factor|uniref:Cell division topological specificity factor n=2 Tax=Photobacterium TaxID=657 RepID=Q1Z5L5_9GAMM|nr:MULTISPECIES: cell division topological specificity factor MinE [Photobacterium]EAS43867.1 cell division topological specificity factor MinE [Photobacterium profundum 3TCK]PSV48564.1 cell division topological specificity factor MinE [Photobacterium indicum]PSV64432.1 cell division topological specificity factor MinE [Photobacterium profundum]